MRIVGGRLSGRRFSGPRSSAVRPTSERVREGIASALSARDAIGGARVLDLFAGTGALAFEALSRGARSALLVERDRSVCVALRKSIEELDLTAEARVLPGDLFRGRSRTLDRIVASGPFDLVFVDPPYAEVGLVGDLLATLGAQGAIAAGAWVVVERPTGNPLASIEGLALIAEYRYGDTTAALLVQTSSYEASSSKGDHRREQR